MNCIKADFYKAVHSKFLLLHVAVVLCGIIVFNGYYASAPWKEYLKIKVYIECIAIAFPLLCAIAISIISESELNAGSFQGMLHAPYSKVFIHLSKFFTISFFGLVASVIAVAGFGIIFIMMGNRSCSIGFYINMGVLMFILNLSVYMIQYIISFSLGRGFGLSCGTIGSLLSALMYTGLGENIWFMIPYAYGLRMGDYISFKTIDSALYETLTQEIIKGKVYILIISVIIFCIFLLWSSKWQGRRYEES